MFIHDASCVMLKWGKTNFNLLLQIRGNKLTAFDNNGLNSSK